MFETLVYVLAVFLTASIGVGIFLLVKLYEEEANVSSLQWSLVASEVTNEGLKDDVLNLKLHNRILKSTVHTFVMDEKRRVEKKEKQGKGRHKARANNGRFCKK
jgi:hypothetical protein